MVVQSVYDVDRVAAPARLEWVDTAKGLSIAMVVAFHTVLGVGEAYGNATGWLHSVIAYAKPFRMPDFFLVSGLFATAAMARPWRDFLDRKVIHFAYFLSLWLAIILLVKAGELDLTDPLRFLSAYLWGFIEPFSTMWFIHLLPILFIVLRLVWNWPIWLVATFGVALHLLAAWHLDPDDFGLRSTLSQWTVINNFCLFFIFFYVGGKAGPHLLRLSSAIAQQSWTALSGLAVWSLAHALIWKADYADVPGIGLILGFAGALAVIVISVLLAKYEPFGLFRRIGAHSLAIYLTFVIPMAAARILLVKSGLVTHVDIAATIVLIVAIAVPIACELAVRPTPLAFLYRRPRWARLR